MDPVPPYHHCSAVRPKERRPDIHQQNPFMRGNTIIRSKTFSPGPQSQYICRVWRDAWTPHTEQVLLYWCVNIVHVSPDKPQWQRLLHALQEVSLCQKCLREAQHANEEGDRLTPCSLLLGSSSRLITDHTVLHQPPLQVKSLDGLLRTSLDLELDLQVSRTRQARLSQELHVLRELKVQLEKARQQGHRELPTWVQEDERFRLLLKQAEKQVSPFPPGIRPVNFIAICSPPLVLATQTQEEQLQEKRVEKMMRAAAKDVHKIRGQSRKEVPEVQTFRWEKFLQDSRSYNRNIQQSLSIDRTHHQMCPKMDIIKERLNTKQTFLQELRRDTHGDLFKLRCVFALCLCHIWVFVGIRMCLRKRGS